MTQFSFMGRWRKMQLKKYNLFENNWKKIKIIGQFSFQRRLDKNANQIYIYAD